MKLKNHSAYKVMASFWNFRNEFTPLNIFIYLFIHSYNFNDKTLPFWVYIKRLKHKVPFEHLPHSVRLPYCFRSTWVWSRDYTDGVKTSTAEVKKINSLFHNTHSTKTCDFYYMSFLFQFWCLAQTWTHFFRSWKHGFSCSVLLIFCNDMVTLCLTEERPVAWRIATAKHLALKGREFCR